MKTQRAMIQEVHQAMFGVTDTDDMGLVGDIKEMKAGIRSQNGRVRKNTIAIVALGASGVAGAGWGIPQLLQLLN